MGADTQTDVVDLPVGQHGRRRRPSSFVWPPPQKVLDRDGPVPRSHRGDEAIEPVGESTERSGVTSSVESAAAAAGSPQVIEHLESAQISASPRPSNVVSRRLSLRLFRGNSLWPLARWQARLSNPPRVIAVALVAVTLIALFEGAYILRMSFSRTGGSSSTSQRNAASSSDASAERVAKGAQSIPAPGVTAVAAASPVPPPTSQTVRLVINSEPPGALVFIDGRHSGVAPMTLTNVTAGQHQLLLRREANDGDAATSVVAPVPGNIRGSGWVAVASSVEVDIWENGALLGTSRSPRIMLAAGGHSLEFVNESLEYRHKQQVRVEAGKVERVEMALPRSAISLNAAPWAEVWIDGESVGQTPIANLPITIGTHEVAFRHPELGERIMGATVKAGSVTRLSADLRQRPAGSR